jgi:hypothetical protein
MWTEAELIELYEERAAIMQHDGGMTQEAAENAAYYEWRKTVGREVVVPDVIRDKVRKWKL